MIKNIENKLQKYRELSSEGVKNFLFSVVSFFVVGGFFLCVNNVNSAPTPFGAALFFFAAAFLTVILHYIKKISPLLMRTLSGKGRGIFQYYRYMKKFEKKVKEDFFSVAFLEEIEGILRKEKKALSDGNFYSKLEELKTGENAQRKLALLDGTSIKKKIKIPKGALQLLDKKWSEEGSYLLLKEFTDFAFVSIILLVLSFAGPVFGSIAAGVLSIISIFFIDVLRDLIRGDITVKEIKNRKKYFKALEKSGTDVLLVSDIAFLKLHNRFDSDNVQKMVKLRKRTSFD